MKDTEEKKAACNETGRGNHPHHISVIIPCYNEEKVIEDTIGLVTGYLSGKGYDYEIIVVDDGSRDRSVDIVGRLAGSHPNLRLIENGSNRGKGYTVRNGFLSARGEYVIFTDADLSTPIEEVEKLLHWMNKGYDIAIGSRSIEGSRVEVHQPFWREWMGRTFNRFVQALAVKGIKDTQCGFKGFKFDAVRCIFTRQRLDGFSFDVEALFIANKLGYSIKEVPIRWLNRADSRVNPLIHPVQMLVDLLRIRLTDLSGGYRTGPVPGDGRSG